MIPFTNLHFTILSKRFVKKEHAKGFFRGFWLHLETSKLLNVPKNAAECRGVHLLLSVEFFPLSFQVQFLHTSECLLQEAQ